MTTATHERSINRTYPQIPRKTLPPQTSTKAVDSFASCWTLAVCTPNRLANREAELDNFWRLTIPAGNTNIRVLLEQRTPGADVADKLAVEKYAPLPYVKAIFSGQFKSERQYLVFVDGREYGSLMLEQLVDLEYVFQENLKSVMVSVSYVPLSVSDNGIVPPAFKRLFSRG